MDISLEYISGGINPTCACASWGKHWLAYGVKNSVALCEIGSEVFQIKWLLRGHDDRVNCVSWINDELLLSGSSDHTARLWHLDKNASSFPLRNSISLQGHTSSVTGVSGILGTGGLIVGTCSGDSTIRLWTGNGSNISILQVIEVPQNAICLCLKLCYLSENVPVLVSGMSNCKISLYIQDDSEKLFHVVSVLPGHSDWVRTLDCVVIPSSSTMLIASASQDKTIRIWKVDLYNDDVVDRQQLQSKELKFRCNKLLYIVKLHTVLTGHEESVSCVYWSSCESNVKLLSASKDKSIILWCTDTSGLWVEDLRVGEVGGSGLGLLGCCISEDCSAILGYGFKGGIYLWRQHKETSEWFPSMALTGHTSAITDVTWQASHCLYLLSTGREDQTCRLHAKQFLREDMSIWHEIARPQIHGYDMSCVASLSPFCYASGSEEKTVRVFQAPRSFVNNFAERLRSNGVLSQSDDDENDSSANKFSFLDKNGDLVKMCLRYPGGDGEEDNEVVSVPALGLSNKVSHVNTSRCSNTLPTEDFLANMTLWPETRKLYGLGREVFVIDASEDGKLLAAASIATTTEQATILVWQCNDSNKWSAPTLLSGHTLTVTELRFSPAPHRFLLSISRDRKWRLWQYSMPESDSFQSVKFNLIAYCPKSVGHTRIIWACAWAFDGLSFFTASRDKKLIAWSVNSPTPGPMGEAYVANEAITAIDCAPLPYDKSHNLLAAGLENGQILLIRWSSTSGFNKLAEFPSYQCHNGRVNKLRFRSSMEKADTSEEQDVIQLASVGDDHLLFVHNIPIIR